MSLNIENSCFGCCKPPKTPKSEFSKKHKRVFFPPSPKAQTGGSLCPWPSSQWIEYPCGSTTHFGCDVSIFCVHYDLITTDLRWISMIGKQNCLIRTRSSRIPDALRALPCSRRTSCFTGSLRWNESKISVVAGSSFLIQFDIIDCWRCGFEIDRTLRNRVRHSALFTHY